MIQVNILNKDWFHKPESNEYENYQRAEEVNNLVQRGDAFHVIFDLKPGNLQVF